MLYTPRAHTQAPSLSSRPPPSTPYPPPICCWVSCVISYPEAQHWEWESARHGIQTPAVLQNTGIYPQCMVCVNMYKLPKQAELATSH